MPAGITIFVPMTTTAPARSLESMPAHARLWVYKSAAAFTPEQRKTINDAAAAFVGGWTSHANAMDAWAGTYLDHFLLISVDQEHAAASGCGIDKSVRFVQDIEHATGLRLTDRMVQLFETPAGIRSVRVDQLPGLLADGTLSANTIVLDDLVTTVGDLRTRFRAPLADTWLARFLVRTT